MVKSDLVTYRGVKMPNLFLQATNLKPVLKIYIQTILVQSHVQLEEQDPLKVT